MRETTVAKRKRKQLSEEKKFILNLLGKVKNGEVQPNRGHVIWEKMLSSKKQYIKRHNSQSWNSFIGTVFQELVFWIIKIHLSSLSKKKRFRNLILFSEKELKKNDVLVKKLSIRYGEDQLILPDTDMAVVDYHFSNPWESEILAIISCKTSLRERIAQTCYWKLKLLVSDTTKDINVFLASSDNDEDFSLNEKWQFGGRSRNRVIAEYELDGIYIVKGDFKKEWESSKVKHYKHIFNDLIYVFRKIHGDR